VETHIPDSAKLQPEKRKGKPESKKGTTIVRWRQGRKVPVNVYEGENPGRPICQCHTAEDAKLIVDAVNRWLGI
jgi:hypothetical protein